MSENRLKIGVLKRVDQFRPNFFIDGVKGRPPPIIFAQIVRPMNALQLCS